MATTMTAVAPGTADGGRALSDIHDIKDLATIQLSPEWWQMLLWVAAGLAILALLILAFRHWRRRPQAEPTPSLPPDRKALQELEALAGEPSSKIFYFRLSGIFRDYLQGRFGLAAPEMTTEELLPRLRSLPIGTTRELECKAFLRRSDPIKFAGIPADLEQMKKDLEGIREFVQAFGSGAQDV